MKKFIFLLCLVISKNIFAASNGCVVVPDDNSITFCPAEPVLVITQSTAGVMAGPMSLVKVTSYDQGFIELFAGRTREVIPYLDLAIMRGCNDNGICINDSVIWKSRNEIFKVAGLFAYGDIVIRVGEESLPYLKPLYLFVRSEDIEKLK